MQGYRIRYTEDFFTSGRFTIKIGGDYMKNQILSEENYTNSEFFSTDIFNEKINNKQKMRENLLKKCTKNQKIANILNYFGKTIMRVTTIMSLLFVGAMCIPLAGQVAAYIGAGILGVSTLASFAYFVSKSQIKNSDWKEKISNLTMSGGWLGTSIAGLVSILKIIDVSRVTQMDGFKFFNYADPSASIPNWVTKWDISLKSISPMLNYAGIATGIGMAIGVTSIAAGGVLSFVGKKHLNKVYEIEKESFNLIRDKYEELNKIEMVLEEKLDKLEEIHINEEKNKTQEIKNIYQKEFYEINKTLRESYDMYEYMDKIKDRFKSMLTKEEDVKYLEEKSKNLSKKISQCRQKYDNIEKAYKNSRQNYEEKEKNTLYKEGVLEREVKNKTL